MSKSRGQVLRLTAVMHMLFNIDNYEQPLEDEVGESAVKAAVNFIQLACQQTAYIAGKETLQEEMDRFKAGTIRCYTILPCISKSVHIHVHVHVQ